MTYPRKRFESCACLILSQVMQSNFARQRIFNVKLKTRKIKRSLYGDIRYRR